MSEKQPAHNFKALKFPDCSTNCALVGYLGVGKCESVCWWKFDKDGKPLETFAVPTDTPALFTNYWDIIVHTITKPKDSK